MSSWISAVPALVIALVTIVAPGLLVASAGGARGIQRWAIAAPLSFSLAGLGSIVFGFVRVPFSPVTFAVLALVAAGITLALRRLLRRSGHLPERTWGTTYQHVNDQWPCDRKRIVWWILCALAALYASIALAWRIMRGISGPENIAQLFDNIFHLNAVRLIAQTHQGSSLTLGNLNEASRSFYPAAFHDITALVMSISGSDVAVALNITSVVLAAVIWPLSLVFFATRLFGERPVVVIAAAVLAPVLGSFPYRMFSFGVLYPFMAGLSMLPVILGLLISLFGVARSAPVPTVTAATALLVASPGVALTHPSVIIAAVAFSTPFALQRIVLTLSQQSAQRKERFVTATIGIAYLLGASILFVGIRPELSSAPWEPVQSYKEAMGAVVLLSPGDVAVHLGVFALSIVGLVAVTRRPSLMWPIAALAAIGALLYIASAALPSGWVRDLLTGVWYRDTQRLAALFAIAALPLAILGFVTTSRVLAAVLSRLRRFRFPHTITPAVLSVTSVVLVTVGTISITQRGPVTQAEEWIAMSFGNRTPPALLSDDERAVLAQIPELVPKDETVLGSPRTGASLVYAFTGRWTIAPHVFGVRTADEQFLLDHWDEAGINPDVCPVIRDLDAYWALDFGTADVQGGNRQKLGGTDSLGPDAVPGIDQILLVGDASLYEAAVCR